MKMNMTNVSTEMDMGRMDDSPMSMTFFFSSSTSLFSKAWTPATSAQYSGTCIFLVVLAVLMRGMLALKPILEKSMWNPLVDGEGVLVPGGDGGYQKEDMAPRQPTNRIYDIVRRRWSIWRFRTSLERSIFELLLATVGYLL